ncbi:hypothetical protein BGW38_000099 [Lunasporangiospora selenospora]|uniref:SGNH hydrolase-type esterase domain-containing protein n=1 Tax=Lunasporangiospora selenospora TaxID=979761 RepID=A0A9P6KHP2_9FUNG|nr:hypothetical protein BGW38_000099 [Lunasporangiospora selenospora]
MSTHSPKVSPADSSLRRRVAKDQSLDPEDDPSGSSTASASSPPVADSTTTVTAPASTTAIRTSPTEATDGRILYNGQTYHGTGRLPRDAPFTPSYVNACTFNAVVAFISLVVTVTFFYFKVIAGLLESPQIGYGYYPYSEGGHATPPPGMADQDYWRWVHESGVAVEPRAMLSPICLLPSEQQQQQQHRFVKQEADDGDRDCRLFSKIVVLADSISKYGYSHATHGWVGSLADEYAGKADVVLRGFPGYNTHWVRTLFPEIIEQDSSLSSPSQSPSLSSTPADSYKTPYYTPIKLVIIALGTDDASLPHKRQHIPVSSYAENIRAIVQSIRYPDDPYNYAPDTQVILVTPAPIYDAMWSASLEAVGETKPDRVNEVTREYAQACVAVAEELGLPVVNLWQEIQCQLDHSCPIQESVRPEDFLMDGLHLRRLGNDVLYKGILNAIALSYPTLHPTCWPSVFPGYLAGTSPEQSLLKRQCRRFH